MTKSTRFKCPNCDERNAYVLAGDSGSEQAQFNCPNCDEPIVVKYDAD